MCGRCSGHLDAVALAARAAEPRDRRADRRAAPPLGCAADRGRAHRHRDRRVPVEREPVVRAAEARGRRDTSSITGPLGCSPTTRLGGCSRTIPKRNDVFTWLDGAHDRRATSWPTALVLSAAVFARSRSPRVRCPAAACRADCRLSYALMPLAGLGVFLGLSSLTVRWRRPRASDWCCAGACARWCSPSRRARGACVSRGSCSPGPRRCRGERRHGAHARRGRNGGRRWSMLFVGWGAAKSGRRRQVEWRLAATIAGCHFLRLR